jgi:hypothetical protein
MVAASSVRIGSSGSQNRDLAGPKEVLKRPPAKKFNAGIVQQSDYTVILCEHALLTKAKEFLCMRAP